VGGQEAQAHSARNRRRPWPRWKKPSVGTRSPIWDGGMKSEDDDLVPAMGTGAHHGSGWGWYVPRRGNPNGDQRLGRPRAWLLACRQ
jgi:hypothetical protein